MSWNIAEETLEKRGSFFAHYFKESHQARSQDFAKGGGGGAFLEVWYSRKRTWPKFLLGWGDFSVKISNLQKKKKRSSPTLGELQDQKPILFWSKWRHVLHTFGSQIPLGWGCFYFWSKNRPQKHWKRAILHTFQANGGDRASRPPGYATESHIVLEPEMESRTQGSRLMPRPRIQKSPRPRTALPRTDPLEAKDRNARGQGQGLRTHAQVFSKKKAFKNFFRRSSKKKRFSKFFLRRSTKF